MDDSKTRQELRDMFELSRPPRANSNLTAIVVAHNEALRLPYFLDFYRSIGVTQFLVVDNASTDGTAEILSGQEDVVRCFTTALYSEYKSRWREVLAESFCTGSWVVFPDVDELLIYPGWPGISLPLYCEILEGQRHEALFCCMIDMYPAEPLVDSHYPPGTPFLEIAPYFDTGNYRLVPYKEKQLQKFRTPPFRICGGARERLFHQERQREPDALDAWLMRIFFGLSWGRRRDNLMSRWRDRAFERVEGVLPIMAPNMSKVPLVRWKRGNKLAGGVHRHLLDYDLAEDWGALLHFKYLHDFSERVAYSAARGQHVKEGAHYKLYASHLDRVMQRSLVSRGSRRFCGTSSLVAEGLMRISRKTRRALRDGSGA